MKKFFAAVIVAGAIALALISPAAAQTSPNLIKGDIPTAAQWNSYFAAKQDVLNYTPLNQAGGTMAGRLVTAAPGATLSGFNLTPGTAPGSPADGDLWVTSASFFVQVNGVTKDLLSGSCAGCALLASANVFTSAVQTVQGLTTTSPGWYAQITGDTSARIRVGLNAADVASIGFGPGSTARDTFIERIGIGSLRFGTADAASPVAQIESVQNVLAGTSNMAGANRTIAGSRGTGTGVGGSIIFQIAPAGSTGSTQNALATAFTIFGTGGLATGAATDQGAGTLNLSGGSLYNNGTAPTGTGAYARATSPAFTTPNLGIPSALVLTNATYVATSTATSTMGCGAGSLTGGTTATWHYWNFGKVVYFNVSGAPTYSACTNSITIPLPNSWTSAAYNQGSAGSNTSNGQLLAGTVFSAQTGMVVFKYDGTFPLASSGQSFNINGTLEIQ